MCIYIYIYIYRVSGTTHLYPCVQVEDVKLSRKVLYHFANFVIINEILIFEVAEKRHVRPAHRQMQALGEIRPPRVAKRARSCLHSTEFTLAKSISCSAIATSNRAPSTRNVLAESNQHLKS